MGTKGEATRGEKTKGKHVPMRRCVVCRTSRPQRDLERFYQFDGTWHHDLKRRAGGRGVWVCAEDETCHKTKALRRTFRAQAETVSSLLQTHRALKEAEQDAQQKAPAAQAHPTTTTTQHLTQHPAQNPKIQGDMNV